MGVDFEFRISNFEIDVRHTTSAPERCSEIQNPKPEMLLALVDLSRGAVLKIRNSKFEIRNCPVTTEPSQ